MLISIVSKTKGFALLFVRPAGIVAALALSSIICVVSSLDDLERFFFSFSSSFSVVRSFVCCFVLFGFAFC